MRKITFTKGSFYHLYNRGVDKRRIFVTQRDYKRFFAQMALLNNADATPANVERLLVKTPQKSVVSKISKNALVDIVAFCFMPNHYHFLVRQRRDNGIPCWMQKLGTAYTMYFNLKYRRTGRLFQSTYKAIPVQTDSYFTHLSRYIHLNPLELEHPAWKERGILDWPRARNQLLAYRWSSLPAYLGVSNLMPNSPRLSLDARYVLEQFAHPQTETYERFLAEWTRRDDEQITDLLFDFDDAAKAKPWRKWGSENGGHEGERTVKAKP